VSVRRNLVTGATGLLGSHVVEHLLARGESVRALVRPGSDTSWLRQRGVELVEGDLNRPDSLPPAMEGADVVYHCAARVGDWGPWRLYQEAIIDATANVLGACERVGVGRLLHVSSINVYGRPQLRPGQLLTEEDRLGQTRWIWDYYCESKIRAEALVQSSPLAWTIVRPSWIYGPRDRNSLPRVIKAVDAGRAAMIGRGDNLLNVVYAGDVADGVVRAATAEVGVRRAYNLASEGAITQKAFLDALTDGLGRPRVRRRFPYWLAFSGGFLAECIGRAIRLRRPPHITRYAVALIGRSTQFSIARARGELGWEPRMPPLEGLRRTLEWYHDRQGIMSNGTLR
jgi:nucleoside-diphosphate-sugar epimerase